MVLSILLLIIFFSLFFMSNKKIQNLGKLSILKSYPYNSEIFTQGIEMINDNLIISTGIYGQSSIGILNLSSGEFEKIKPLDRQYFGEGLTYDNKYIWQLTWKEETAFIRDAKTLEIVNKFMFKGEGWGICYDGKNLIMSNGTSYLSVRDTNDFKEKRKILVTEGKQKVEQLNELEFYNGYIYANVWHSDYILKINPDNGVVVKKYNASVLLKDKSITKKELNKFGVLNGIAHLHDNVFLISGKNWTRIFEVELD